MSYLTKTLIPIICFNSLFSSLCAVNIEIITSLAYNLNMAPDIIQTGAAFDTAAERFVSEDMRNSPDHPMSVRLHYLFNASTASSYLNCSNIADDSGYMLSKYYYERTRADTCYAIVTSPCDDERGIHSLARGFDWVVFANGLSKNDFMDDNVGSPTAVAAGGTFAGYARVVIDVLRFYRWYRFSILVELNTTSLFYGDLASLILQETKANIPSKFSFQAEKALLDTRKVDAIKTALIWAKQRSRVIILLTPGLAGRRLLNMTGSLGMTNGKYVFINVQPLQVETYGMASQFQDSLDDQTLIALRSFLFITFAPSGLMKDSPTANDQTDLLNEQITQRAKTVYNTSYSDGLNPLDLYSVETSYAIVELFATVVQQTNPAYDGTANCSGLLLASYMENQTFQLSSGQMYINSDRARNLGLQILGFNTSTGLMQRIGVYNWQSSVLEWDQNRAVSWPTRDGQAPNDAPLCGFSGDQGPCAPKALDTLTTFVVAVICVGLLSVVLFIIRWFYVHRKRMNFEECGRLLPGDLCFR